MTHRLLTILISTLLLCRCAGTVSFAGDETESTTLVQNQRFSTQTAAVGESIGAAHDVSRQQLVEPASQLSAIDVHNELPLSTEHQCPCGQYPHRFDCPRCSWSWQFLPDGLLYKSYLAGPKEARFASAWLHEEDRGWIWDISLGGRVGIFRFGTPGAVNPDGWQLDIEGAAFPRLDSEEDADMESADFRFGVPITWSRGPLEMKLAYYHISAHVGDEFLTRNPMFQRVNYVRDSALLGVARHLTPDVRAYSEAAWAFNSDVAQPWEFQFGIEYSPRQCCGKRGSPYLAVNTQLFEEHDFGGSVNLMVGRQWRGKDTDRLLRFGLQYFNGKSSQYAFYNEYEELLGFGLWFDY